MNSVPQIILQQLGGGRFVLMTGAKSFTASTDSLSFRLPRCKDGIQDLSDIKLYAVAVEHFAGGCPKMEVAPLTNGRVSEGLGV